jgi:hypothetical protein
MSEKGLTHGRQVPAGIHNLDVRPPQPLRQPLGGHDGGHRRAAAGGRCCHHDQGPALGGWCGGGGEAYRKPPLDSSTPRAAMDAHLRVHAPGCERAAARVIGEA